MGRHVADQAVDGDGFVPVLRTGPQRLPLGGTPVGAEGAGGTGWDRVAVFHEPVDAVLPAHPALVWLRPVLRRAVDQRVALGEAADVRGLHAYPLVGRDPQPRASERHGRTDRLVGRPPEQLLDAPLDWLDLVIGRALAAQHPMRSVGVDGEEGRREVAVRAARHRLHTGRGRADVVGEVGELDDLDREGQHVARPQPVQMLVDRLRLRAGVGEDGGVRHGLDLAMGRHQRHGRRLHAGAERDHMHDWRVLGHGFPTTKRPPAPRRDGRCRCLVGGRGTAQACAGRAGPASSMLVTQVVTWVVTWSA